MIVVRHHKCRLFGSTLGASDLFSMLSPMLIVDNLRIMVDNHSWTRDFHDDNSTNFGTARVQGCKGCAKHRTNDAMTKFAHSERAQGILLLNVKVVRMISN